MRFAKRTFFFFLLVLFCKLGLCFEPFKFTGDGWFQLQRCRRLKYKWFPLPAFSFFSLSLYGLASHGVDHSHVSEMFGVWSATVLFLRALGWSVSSFPVTRINVLFTVYIINALIEIFSNAVSLLIVHWSKTHFVFSGSRFKSLLLKIQAFTWLFNKGKNGFSIFRITHVVFV